MDFAEILVALLVIGAPLALFLSLRQRAQDPQTPAADAGPARRSGSGGSDDYGLAREDSPGRAAPAEAQDTTAAARDQGAAAAAAGGAFILAAGLGHRHAAEGGGESPQAGHSGGGPDSGGGSAGGGDGAGDGAGAGGGD